MLFIKQIQKNLVLAILFLLPLYLIKFKFVWLSFNLVEILIFILFLLWIFNKNTKYNILNTKCNIPIILIFTGLFFSVIANNNYYIGLGAIKGWFIFPIIFGIIFYESMKEDESLLGKSWLALLFSGVAVSMMGIVYKFSGLLTYDGRLHIFYDSPNQLGMFLAPIFIVGLVLFLRENLYWRKLLFLAGLFLLAVNLYFTYSYGTWMALAVAITVVFWLKHKTLRSRVGILILVFLAAIAIGQMRSQKMADLENMGGRSSIDSRIMIWKAAGLMIESNPLFGIGPGNFQNKYLEYQKYFPPYLEWAVPQPHNLFLAFWLEAGFLGLVGFVFLLVQFFKDNKKAIENNHLYGTLCFAVMLYLLVHGLIDTTYWRNDMAIIFWTIISINTFLSSKGKAQGD